MSWGLVFVVFELIAIGRILVVPAHAWFPDALIYYRATEAWVAGGDPWAVSHIGVRFGAWPPALLLNLPLLPFGEGFALLFWPLAGLAGAAYAIRRLGLSWVWLLFPPLFEGWQGGSPDLVLFGLIVAGGGALSALAKPYAVPAMLADGRWRAVLGAGVLGVVTLPLLPWGAFLGRAGEVAGTLGDQSANLSAWGQPVVMGATAVALLVLGRRGLGLATPALWPAAQPHYALFSLSAVARSPWLALVVGLPIPLVAPLGITAYAVWLRRSRSPGPALRLRWGWTTGKWRSRLRGTPEPSGRSG